MIWLLINILQREMIMIIIFNDYKRWWWWWKSSAKDANFFLHPTVIQPKVICKVLSWAFNTTAPSRSNPWKQPEEKKAQSSQNGCAQLFWRPLNFGSFTKRWQKLMSKVIIQFYGLFANYNVHQWGVFLSNLCGLTTL